MSQSKEKIFLNKGHAEYSYRVFQAHIRYAGDNGGPYFRDYLIERSDVAKEYEKLKMHLGKKYAYYRDAYAHKKESLCLHIRT